MRFRWHAVWFLMLGTFTAICFLLALPAHSQSFLAPKYDCKPKTQEEYRIGREGSTTIGVWYCELPDRIRVNYFAGNPTNIPSLISIPSLDKIGTFLQQSLSRPATDAELALLEKVHQQQGIKILVAPNGTAKDRPVYKATATNTRGATTTARAKVGDWCGWRRLQDDLGKPTNYFQVDGGYTLCQVIGTTTK